MRGGRGIWIVAVLAASSAAAAVGVHASSAAPTRVTTRSSTIDRVYSCRVRRQHYVVLDGSVTLPPVQKRPQPGALNLTTIQKTIRKKNVVITVAQLGLSAAKNSRLSIDKSSCRLVTQRIALTPKGLPGPPETVTPHHQGYLNQRCGTTARVLVRLRVTIKARAATHALLAIRNDDATRRPVAFYDWSPRKLSSYTGNSCVDLS